MEEFNVDESYIKSVLKQIVDKVHTHPQKKEVRDKAGGGFQIACPYCGDSHKNPNNYRGNLNKILYYKCFNDGCDKKTHFTSMTKDFGIDIDGETKKQIYGYLDKYTNNIESLEDELLENGMSFLIDFDKLQNSINTNTCDSKLHNLKSIQKGSAQYYYLMEDRGLINNKLWKNIYQADFYITPDWKEKCIVYLNRKANKIIGMQVRNLKEGNKRLFHIYTYEDLHDWVGDKEVSDGQLMMYNKLSYFYGILDIDFSKDITLFEGYGDAVLMPNSIGLAGVNTDTSFMEQDGITTRYFFDNDDAGHLKSEEKMKEGREVFLWEKLFKWLVENKNDFDPYSHYNKIKKVKDLTKLNSILPNAYIELKLENYFSVDRFDLKYIPKIEKKKNYYDNKHKYSKKS